jgi:superfamily I DNA/RNA helicase
MIAPGDWHPADKLTLEPNALRAARETQRCQALTAGPGAGKTEMLAQRADFLLRTGTCRYPKRILAISFKVDASKNLKERVQRRCGAELASRFDSYTFHAFAKRIIDRFRPVLTGQDALDVDYKIGDRKVTRRQIEFSDLVPMASRILETSAVARNAIRQTYSDVFLDEFQDCTDQQYTLVKLAFQDTTIRLTAVGDTKQKIMGWAGALDGIFQTFAADFAAEPLNMYRNFRSKPRLLRMQNAIIKRMDPAAVMPDEQLAGNEGQIFAWQYPNSQAEAESLADLIDNWINGEHLAHSEIAILFARQPDLYGEHLMAALQKRDIPYRNEQQIQDISVEPAARLVVDYLSCLYGQREPKAWIRLMAQLIPFADEDVQSGIRQDFQRFIAEQRRNAALAAALGDPFADWWDSVRTFLNKVGIATLSALSPDYESKARLKEIINDTKTRIDELLKLEPDLPKALGGFSEDQAVRLLTIHKSKGLEFDSVIVLGLENQTFWGEEDAERCAFFVSISRAKRRLILTVCEHRDTPPSNPRMWREDRTPHAEFLGYATPFLNPP